MYSQHSPSISVESLPDSDMDSAPSSPIMMDESPLVDKINAPRKIDENPQKPVEAKDDSRSPFLQNGKYFFPDGTVTFVVEDELYSVHRSFLEQHAPWFRGLPRGSHTHPIPLPGVRARDFDRFLSVLYPSKISARDASSVEEWTSVLDLAARWGAADIVLLATTELAPIASPVDKIVLGRKYYAPIAAACPITVSFWGSVDSTIENIGEWLRRAYRPLFAREEDLTLEEGERLGMAEVIKIAHARRERLLMRRTPKSRQKGYENIDRATENLVQEAVGVEEPPVVAIPPDATPNEALASPNVVVPSPGEAGAAPNEVAASPNEATAASNEVAAAPNDIRAARDALFMRIFNPGGAPAVPCKDTGDSADKTDVDEPKGPMSEEEDDAKGKKIGKKGGTEEKLFTDEYAGSKRARKGNTWKNLYREFEILGKVSILAIREVQRISHSRLL